VHAGARTVMILGGEPTLYLPDLLEFLGALPDTVPVALKTNALFADPVRTLLAGLIDVWIPDFKFGNDDCAHRLAGAPDYVATVTDNLRWMASSAAGGRLLVRHLLMPGHLDCCWAPAARWLAHHLPGVAVSLRAGYWPGWHADRHPELNRSVPAADLARAESLARELGLPLAP